MHATSNGFVWILNVQASHDGVHFYVNLGAHPLRLLSDGQSLSLLRAGACAFVTRVGERWGREPLDETLVPLFSQEEATFRTEIIAGIANVLATAGQDSSVLSYRAGRHFLLFAQICAAYGQSQHALQYLAWGQPRVPASASGLLRDIEKLRQSLER